MGRKVKLFGHAIHPMLIVFLLGLLSTAVLFDVTRIFASNDLFAMVALAGVLVLLTAWMGGEVLERLGVGVDDGANLNAPSSHAGRHALATIEVDVLSRREE